MELYQRKDDFDVFSSQECVFKMMAHVIQIYQVVAKLQMYI